MAGDNSGAGTYAFSFTPDFQKHLFAVLARTPGIIIRFRSALSHTYFVDPSLSLLSRCLLEHVDKHKIIPVPVTLAQAVSEVADDTVFEAAKNLIADAWEDDISDAASVVERIVAFGQQQAMINAILEASKKLERGDRDVMELVRQAGHVGEDVLDVGLDYNTFDRKKLYTDAVDDSVYVPTGITHLDRALGGGGVRGTLNVLLGAAKGGKSTGLVNIGFGPLQSISGFTVFHYTHEMQAKPVARRYDVRLAGDHWVKRTSDPDKYAEIMQDRVNKLIFGRLIIRQYTTRTATVSNLRSHISILESQGIRPDVIISDYADIMKPERRIGEFRHEQASIYEDLRTLAGETNSVVWTASQARKASFGKERLDMGDFAECLPAHTLLVDGMCGRVAAVGKLVSENVPLALISLSNCQSGIMAESSSVSVSTATKWFSVGEKKCFEIVVESSEPIEVGENHMWLTRRGWVKTKDLRKGDYVAKPRSSPYIGTESMNYDAAQVLGFYVANGCSGYGYTSLAFDHCKVNYAWMEKAVSELFGCYFRKDNRPGLGVNVGVADPLSNAHCPNRFSTFLKEMGVFGKKSWEKTVEFAFGFDAPTLRRFLRGLFTGDGSIIAATQSVEYSTTSPVMARQLRELLLRLGIVASVYRYKDKRGYRDCFKLRFGRKENLEPFTEIGCCGRKGDEFLSVYSALKSGRKGDSRAAHWDEKVYWAPVKKIISTSKKRCYDLQATPHSNYTIGGMLCHNSGEKGDIMDVGVGISQTDDEEIENRCRMVIFGARDIQDNVTIECSINRARCLIMSTGLFDPAGMRITVPEDSSDASPTIRPATSVQNRPTQGERRPPVRKMSKTVPPAQTNGHRPVQKIVPRRLVTA